MLTDSKNFLSMQVKSSDNLSEEDIEDLKLIIPEDQHEQMLEGKQPEGVGIHFSAESVAACESRETLQWAQYHLLEKEVPTPGWRVEERATIGCVHFEMPPEADRLYLLVGDPGQDNPPHRNSPVIAVWDITDFPDKPAELRCFQWVFGNGSYDPFKIAYKYCYETYRPIEAIVDDTGSQKLWTEQVFFNLGIWTIGSNFAGMKEGMLVATQQQVQRRLYKWPFILGFRSQLVRYDITQDNKNSKLPQDIVAMLMMTSWHLRKYLWEDVAEKSTPAHPVELRSAKFQRETPLTARG